MVKIVKKISLEVSKPNIIQAIVAKQYDNNSRFLQVTLIHEGKKIEISPTSTVLINAKRTDGEEKPFAGGANNDGTATVPLTYWMLELEGLVICDVSVIDTDGRKLTSTKFDLQVEKASCSSVDITEDENYDVLIKLIEDVGKVTPDYYYDPTSENAQSGVAVAEGIKKAKYDVANAVKGYASGKEVHMDDVSPIEHKVKINVNGKNLLNPNANIEKIGGYIGVKLSKDKHPYNLSIALKNGASVPSGVSFGFTYFAYGDNKAKANWLIEDGNFKENTTNTTRSALAIENTETIAVVVYPNTQENWNAIFNAFDVQLEYGTQATDFEPYIDPTTVIVTEETTETTYTPNADGLCEIVSVSPIMSFSTDTEGITIEVEYNKDTNKVIGDVETALTELHNYAQGIINGGASV